MQCGRLIAAHNDVLLERTAVHRSSPRRDGLRLNLAAALVAILPVAASAQMLAPPQNVLQLAAEASAEVLQDMLTITLSVTREGTDAASVQSQLRQTLDAALTEGRKAVRPGQLDLRTGAFALYPRYAAKPVAGNNITGWQGRAELVLEGRDIAAIGALAGKLGTGGLVVSQVQFGLSREAREAAEVDVASRAISRFKGRAETYAKQFGFASYSLREVAVGGGDLAPQMAQASPRMARTMAATGADESQPLEAGKALVSVTVSGSIQLSPR